MYACLDLLCQNEPVLLSPCQDELFNTSSMGFMIDFYHNIVIPSYFNKCNCVHICTPISDH